MPGLSELGRALWATLFDVLPLVVILVGFQVVVLRRPLVNLRRTLIGCTYAVIGLALFLIGLEEAFFPLGKLMAQQLTQHAVAGPAGALGPAAIEWHDYGWVYLFAAAMGFSTTVAEPALIAVALKAEEVSGAALNPWGLRLAVAVGVALGVTLGTFRIVTGTPLQYYILVGYVLVIVQTLVAPKEIIALAYDSGGVTTSTVTVPLVTALGLGLASTVPGRSPMIDGFGLIAFASLFPMLSVMSYAQLGQWRVRRRAARETRRTSMEGAGG